MPPEIIVGAVIVGVIVLFFLGKLFPKRQPKETHFKCARCGAVTRHTDRTIEAWRNNKTKFFCPACHTQWLQSRPPHERKGSSQRAGSRTPSGCLGVFVLLAVLPAAVYFLAHVYA
jgi:hypothetical protein